MCGEEWLLCHPAEVWIASFLHEHGSSGSLGILLPILCRTVTAELGSMAVELCLLQLMLSVIVS